MKIQNVHDKFFKETFSKLEVAKDFINNYLPEGIRNIIDINTLHPLKDTFIDKELNEVFSDLLFGVNINNRPGYLYFLFEHKSFTSKNIAFQLLKYMVEIWEDKIENEQIDELPIIIPLVIYHGKNKWNIRSTLGEMIAGYETIPEDVKEFIPNYKYLLYDVSRYQDEDIKGAAQLKILLTIFRDIFIKDKEGLQETITLAAKYLRELESRQTGVEYFETFLRYVFYAGKSFNEEDLQKITEEIERIYPEGSELIMTTAERLIREGMEKGIKEGIEEGIKKGRSEEKIETLTKTAIRLLTKKFGSLPLEIKSKIQNLDSDTLEVLIDDIFVYESLDDLNKFLK
ncbi:conserved hypothetical protein (putative transposase or invertase) [Desulfonispora thiosulfatigenes DSM 11270]|uniref:Transposase (putative) YhgA-like domain-containing protein n=1 Tax=Desulfonispora thiosulfatigenes DSM 11270 TaxID=656914 RepID=A0A1W1V9S6_DESTI|nr:Rpn family recombination-promoting nuclease/putative transposase [Desulfonispora thiosulfatigenes]SMB89970.1 conserved hypothetical protein (putative transposase or invertase) [Desulfonispora thiosulfatigenes DSM 11270]